jgi:hypothetical protein
MVRIETCKRNGFDGYLATIVVEGRTVRSAWRWSEAGARTWVREELDRLGAELLRKAA